MKYGNASFHGRFVLIEIPDITTEYIPETKEKKIVEKFYFYKFKYIMIEHFITIKVLL